MEHLKEWIVSAGLDGKTATLAVTGVYLLLVVVLAVLSNTITKKILLAAIESIAKKSKTSIDDILIRNRFFKQLSHLAPATVLYLSIPMVFAGYARVIALAQRLAFMTILVIAVFIINSLLNAVSEIYEQYDISRRVSIRSFVQAAKIILFLLLGIIILSVLIDKSPAFFFGGLGAMAAVLMLVFKDAILGFVAGIQMSANQMVRIGDWIEMPKYGADGDVIDITLTTVKVRNWNKTITTIPAYAMISDSFKNWRGMTESGGRRIKRAVYIDMTSIRFCTNEMLDKFSKFKYISDYISNKKVELAEYNKNNQVDESERVNGRRLTNVGTFRAYLVAYLKHHPRIHQDMTFLVRQLDPTDHGLPIEIYVFSKEQKWADYESIQADLFDHILAVLPEFGLKVFQSPSGWDFRQLSSLNAPPPR